MRYEELSLDISRRDIAIAVREIVRELQRAGGTTTSQIVNGISKIDYAGSKLTENAIKLFLGKQKIERVNKNNEVVPLLYEFIQTNLPTFPENVKFFAVNILSKIDHRLLLEEDMKQIDTARRNSIGKSLSEWMGSKLETVTTLGNKLSGKFFLFRKSAEEDNVVLKSNITFQPNSSNDVVHVEHVTVDRAGNKKRATGVAIPVLDNIYCLLESGEKSSMEMIVFHEIPNSLVIDSAMGIITTTDLRRVPICAKMAIMRFHADWAMAENRIVVDDLTQRNKRIIKEILPMLDKGVAMKVAS